MTLVLINGSYTAAEQPVQSATIALLVAGVCLLLTDQFAALVPTRADAGCPDTGILSGNYKDGVASEPHQESIEKSRRLDGCSASRRFWLVLSLATCALVLRVEVWRRLVEHSNCGVSSGWVSSFDECCHV